MGDLECETQALEEDRARADTQVARNEEGGGGLFGLCISTRKQEGVQAQGG